MAKRWFDVLMSAIAIVLFSWLFAIVGICAALSTRSTGVFAQQRIGRYGRPFTIYKFRTMHAKTGNINAVSRFLRRSKLDEIPQLFNVLKGDMSLVGPRPDVPGYYDKLQGEAAKLLELRPGITSAASVRFKNEEALLAKQSNPLRYNDEVIFPEKIRMNLDYYENQSFLLDLKILFKTIFQK